VAGSEVRKSDADQGAFLERFSSATGLDARDPKETFSHLLTRLSLLVWNKQPTSAIHLLDALRSKNSAQMNGIE